MRTFLQHERRFFNNKSEITFAEANSEFCVNLSNRERALLVLDKRVCWSRSVSDDANDWTDCKNKLMHYHVKHYIQTKAHEREKKIMSLASDQSEEHAETDENDDSSAEADDYG